MVERVVTPERFAQGMTFADYVSYTASRRISPVKAST
jgi:hypothetical protein